jgi:hypothetical protein
MAASNRKSAIAEYKKRKPVAGIYAVRCATSGQVWVGRTLDLEKIQTRLWFGLRTGGNHHPAMQSAWNAHGGDGFALEAVEMLEDEQLDYLRDALLKDRLAHWRTALNAGLV